MLDKWTWQMANRDSKGSRRRLLPFLSAMVIGVAALVAILSFGHSLERTIDQDAGSLLGGDLRISSSDPFTPTEELLIDSLGGMQARRVSFATSAKFSGQSETRTVQVRAIEQQFPLYGDIAVSPHGAEGEMHSGGSVLVPRSTLSAARVEPGDTVTIRGRHFLIAGILLGARVENAIHMLFEPPVYMSLADLDSLQGSSATYDVFFRFNRDMDLVALEADIQKSYEVRTRIVEDEKEDWQEFLALLEGFLGVVGFFALILGSLGVGSVLQVHCKERHDTVAVMRCLGASSGRATSVYLVQAIAMGVIVGVAAGVVGTLGQVILPLGIVDLLPVDINYRVSLKGLLSGLGIGVGATLLFALLPLSGLREVSPLEALRTAYGHRRIRKSRLGVYALIALGTGLCAWAQSGRVVIAIIYTVAIGICFGLLALTALGFIKLARAITPQIRNYAIRQGMANMYRPNNQTLLMVLALGLGTVMIMTQVMTQGAVVGAYETMNFEAVEFPDLVLPTVSSEELEDVRNLVREHGLDIVSQEIMISLAVDSIYGRSIADSAMVDTAGRSNADRSSHFATFADARLDSLTVLEGTFEPEWHDTVGAAPVAMNSLLAREELHVAVGDTIVFRVNDETALVRIGSIFANAALQSSFVPLAARGIILPRGVLETLPHVRSIMLKADDTQSLSAFYGTVTDRYPDLPVLNVPLILGVVQKVFSRITYMIRFMSLFSIIAGIMVLAGAVMVSRQARVEQTVLLKTLGASKKQVYTIMCTEYLCLGFLATATGLGLAMTAAWAITGFQLNVVMVVPKVPLAVAAGVLMVLTLGVGLLNSRGIYARPPLEVLRAEV